MKEFANRFSWLDWDKLIPIVGSDQWSAGMPLGYLTKFAKTLAVSGWTVFLLVCLMGITESAPEEKWYGYLLIGGSAFGLVLSARLRVRFVEPLGGAPHLKIRSWFRSYSIPITEHTKVITDSYDGFLTKGSRSSAWTVIKIKDGKKRWRLNMTLNSNPKTFRNARQLQILIDQVNGSPVSPLRSGGVHKAS